MERIDELNQQMEFLVNRTYAFNKKEFKYFIMNKIENNEKYFLCYQILYIISTMKNIPLYINARQARKVKWINSNFLVSPLKIFWLKLKSKGLEYSMSTKDEKINDCMCPKIYWGITTAEVKEIANKLYQYEELYGN